MQGQGIYILLNLCKMKVNICWSASLKIRAIYIFPFLLQYHEGDLQQKRSIWLNLIFLVKAIVLISILYPTGLTNFHDHTE